jgi:pescadillo protein
VAVEFSCRAFGGKVSWQGLGDDTETVGRGPYKEDDARITHQIVDRPALANMRPERHYVQPQWVFDSINARRLLPTAPYTVGAVLPPHLSPFEVPEDDGYVPPEAQEGKSALASLGDGEEAEDSEEDSEEEEDAANPEDEEDLYRQELAAETAGEIINEKAAASQKKKAVKKAAQKVKTAEEEQKELAISLMPKKHAKLYGKIMHGKAKKQAETDKLRAKRKAHDEATTNKKAKKSSK